MTEIIHPMADRNDDTAVEALAHVLAIQHGMLRSGTPEEMASAFTRLPPDYRHGYRELAQAYVTVVRDAEARYSAYDGLPVCECGSGCRCGSEGHPDCQRPL